jgi:cytochrome c oxidase cbb3-type subunit 3/ubiquinol-cytochrome c reductase cytochrome c subunit
MHRVARGFVVLALIAASCPSAGAAGDSAEPRSGAVLYEQYCRPCHGADLQGYAADNAPSLASPTFRATANDAFLRSAIARGRAGTAMAGYSRAVGGPLSVVDVDEVIAYVRGGTRPSPLDPRLSTGSAADGAQVYQADCQRCHGTAEQRGDAVHLANPMFLDSASDAFLRAAIERGRPGTQMEGWAGKLTSQQIEDVIAYLRSLARPVPPLPEVGDLPPLDPATIVVNPKGRPANFTLREDRYVSVADLHKAYEEKRRLVIIDARPTSDYLRAHITGAISIPHFDLRDLSKVPNDGTWIVAYCACPHHLSGVVFEELRKRGYKHSAVLDEGIFAWLQNAYATTTAPGQLPFPAPPSNAAAKPTQ